MDGRYQFYYLPASLSYVVDNKSWDVKFECLHLFLHPRLWRDRYNSFDIVCLSVRLAIVAKQAGILHWILAWRSIERISRSSWYVKVIGLRSRSWGKKMFIGTFHWLMRALSMDLPKKKLRNMNMTGRNTMWGVSKAYVVSFHVKLFIHMERWVLSFTS